nr:hypothetical protein [Tanacetum cinerariifolium]
MTNNIDTLLKAINDRMTIALPSDMVKSPKLNVKPTSLVSSARSYLMEDPQSSSRPFSSINVVKTCFKATNDFQKDQLQVKTLTVNKVETPKLKEPERALENKFKDLNLKLLVLEVGAILDKYDAFRNKQYKPGDVQELFRELFNDVQNIHEELAEYINTLGWNRPAFYNNGDDDDEDCTTAITPNEPVDSLIMRDEHLDTIPEKESDEFIKSSVENLAPNPSELEYECECNVPDCDDSQTTNFSTFSNPLFDDSTSSDDKSSYEEVIHEMSFKTYSNPLFDLEEEIISSEFNPIHNEDLDSTPKNNRFDTKSYLFESLLNRDESIPPGIDSDDSNSEGDTLSLERLLHDDSIPLPDILDFSNVV